MITVDKASKMTILITIRKMIKKEIERMLVENDEEIKVKLVKSDKNIVSTQVYVSRKNEYAILKGHSCKIVDISCFK